jgi:hypothetical protein
LHLAQMDLAEAIPCKRPELVRRLYQPPSYRMGVPLKPPRRAPDASPLGQAREHAHDAFHRLALAMEERAMRLQEITFASGAVELTPGTTIGMAIGPQVARPQAAALAAVAVGTKVHGGVDDPGTPVGRVHGGGWQRRRWRGRRGFLVTQGPRGFLGQPCKRVRLLGALTPWCDGRGWSLLGSDASAGPGVVQHDTPPQESQNHQLVVEQVRNHGMPPVYGGVTGTLYRVSGVRQLSAGWRYTTHGDAGA